MRRWTLRLGPWLPFLVGLGALNAFARVGGGEHYSVDSGEDGGSGDAGELVGLLFWLVLRHPVIGVPLLIMVAIAYVVVKRNGPGATTRRAFQQREADLRTTVTASEVQGWVNTLRLKDPDFALPGLLDKVKRLFVAVQDAWFKRDLTPVRPFLSDASYQRLRVQLELLQAQGVRDAIADVSVLDVQLVGLDQSEWFDTVRVRVRAEMRDAEAPAGASDEQAVARARREPPETFIEVWSFVRKPGAQTRIGADLYQGKCPNCGAPYRGGATNICEFCQAVVNSGNYDWTLAEITQGIEHIRHYATVDGLLQAREKDPALNLETLEDRASLVFWKWIEAQSTGEARRLAKVATGAYLEQLSAVLDALEAQRRRKVFRDVAVGAATVRVLDRREDFDHAHVELRWSGRLATGPVDQEPPPLPVVPQRWMFTLVRRSGATTNTGNGMSTSRCPQCNAPLGDSLSATCDYCGTELSGGKGDWVLASALSFEAWTAAEEARFRALSRPRPAGMDPGVLTDPDERERLLYLMAAVAGADGVIDERERKLLRMCADRWSVPRATLEAALSSAGPELYDLVAKGTAEAEVFLRALVQMALIDGKVDRREHELLDAIAAHLGVADRLPELLQRRGATSSSSPSPA